MILSAQTIRLLKILNPTRDKYTDPIGNSAGLGSCSYDLTLDHPLELRPDDFKLAAAAEEFNMPHHVAGIVHDKSSLIRRGVAVHNTLIDPGWRGFLTLEIKNVGVEKLYFPKGSAICQVVFHLLDAPTDTPYKGKYQDQERGPQPARRHQPSGGL